MNKKKILFASGDGGGARAVIPLIEYAIRQSFDTYVVKNGFIANDGYNPMYRYTNILPEEIGFNPDIYIFSSSMADLFVFHCLLLTPTLKISFSHI